MTPDSIESECGGPSRGTFTADGIGIFEETHMISIMLYVRDHPDCRKVEIRKALGNIHRLLQKLEVLQNAGLLVCETRGGIQTLSLTCRGLEVAKHLNHIRHILENQNRPE